MLIRRTFCFLMLVFIIVRIYYAKSIVSNLKFFTAWGIYITFITFFFGSLPYKKSAESRDKINKAAKCYHVLFEIVLVSEVIITLVFWLGIYPTKAYKIYVANLCLDRPVPCLIIDLDHIIPIVLMSIDFIISKHIFLKRHWIIIFFGSFPYVIFSFTYTMVHGVAIYPLYDWNKPNGYINTAVSVGFNVGVFLII
jgi:hypothetical protein